MMGEPKKLANPNENVTAPYQNAWSPWLAVKRPTSAGSTGTIRPMAIMSISTVTMMKRMAAAGCCAAGGSAGTESN
jgi:hypothetical protein